ncbi:opsin, ultraviolet-sensitive [Phlebotomus argentipes]|uniref:opsin, ultraviolet-sensitive n=1 Tax=Phlebotomus argentipes TaxID=94469 RepID=UPI002892E0C9|nr:opsin, ultraviolet-sensitive [Phlebotomus argentipes]
METIKSFFVIATDGDVHGENSTILKQNLWRNFSASMGFRGEIEPEFLSTISILWLRAQPPTAQEHFAMGLAYTCMMILGVTGNSLVIYMFYRCRTLRTPANTLVINLALSDLGMMAKIPVVIYNSFHYGPALGSLACQLYGFIGGLTGTVSIATLTAIAFERYRVIVYPLSSQRSASHQRIIIGFVWCFALFFSGIPLLDIGMGRYVPEGYITCCSFDYLSASVRTKIFLVVFFICAWCVPFLTIAFCYLQILRAVAFTNRLQCTKNCSKIEMKLAAVVFGVIALWFIAWTPYAVVALLGISKFRYLLTPFNSMLPAFFCKAAACLNPYFYALTHPRFRHEIRRMFNEAGRKGTLKYVTSFSRFATRRRTIREAFDSEDAGERRAEAAE